MLKNLKIRLAVVIITCFLLTNCSCNIDSKETNNYAKGLQLYPVVDTIITYYPVHIRRYTLRDGCDYIGYISADPRDNFLTHAGTCRNPIHKK